jgi:hypothetical protein
MATRPDGKRFWTLFRKTVGWWDLAVAIPAAGLMLWVGLRDPDFDPAVGFFLAGIPASLILLGAVFTLQRLMGDRIHDQDYGEIVQAVDPDLSVANLPYATIALAAFLSAAVCVVGALAIGDTSPGVGAMIAAGAVGAFTYAGAGLFFLYLLTMKHRSFVARVEAAKQRAARAQRTAQAQQQ